MKVVFSGASVCVCVPGVIHQCLADDAHWHEMVLWHIMRYTRTSGITNSFFVLALGAFCQDYFITTTRPIPMISCYQDRSRTIELLSVTSGLAHHLRRYRF
jgi:hypothetical protein